MGEPVDPERERRRADQVGVAVVQAALRRDQRSDQDRAVDDPRGILFTDDPARDALRPAG
jgi:hypothetical protein